MQNKNILTGFFARTNRAQNDGHLLRHPEFISGSQGRNDGNAKAASRIIRDVAGVTSRSTLGTAQPLRNDNQSLLRQSRKCGFTLAEVLITLGIIGVVAAMTLPALIQGQQKKALETALHKNYSILQQALTRMNYDAGEPVNTQTFKYVEFRKNFMKYFKNVKDCQLIGCVPNEGDADIDGTVYITKKYKTYNNKNYAQSSLLDDGQFMFGTGEMIYIEHPEIASPPLWVTVDVNGLKKGPNRWGHDLFTFQIKDGKLLPMGMDGTDNTECSINATSMTNGIGCTYRALTDKTYWKNLPK